MARDYRQFFAICKKHGFEYKDKVAEFTEGRTDSLSSLSDGEFKELMIRLSRLNAPARVGFTPKPGDAMRKKMMAIANKMCWGKTTLDIIGKLNVWCLQQKYKKAFMDLDPKELTVLLTILETKVYTNYLKNLNR